MFLVLCQNTIGGVTIYINGGKGFWKKRTDLRVCWKLRSQFFLSVLSINPSAPSISLFHGFSFASSHVVSESPDIFGCVRQLRRPPTKRPAWKVREMDQSTHWARQGLPLKIHVSPGPGPTPSLPFRPPAEIVASWRAARRRRSQSRRPHRVGRPGVRVGW